MCIAMMDILYCIEVVRDKEKGCQR